MLLLGVQPAKFIDSLPPPPPPPPRPNVILIVLDDADGESIAPDIMPYFSSVIDDEWVRFPWCVPATPWCGPSRATLLTAQRTDYNNVIDNFTDAMVYADCINVPIRAAGYQTWMLGKYENTWGLQDPLPVGWSNFFGQVEVPDIQSHYFYNWTMRQSVPPQSPVTVTGGEDPEDYLTDVLSARAVDLIATADPDYPFFMYLAYTGPHYPSTPAPRHVAAEIDLNDPPDWNVKPANGPAWLTAMGTMDAAQEASTRTMRLNSMRAMLSIDEGIEAIVGALTTQGILDNTIIMFLIDNSNARGRKGIGEDRKFWDKTSPYMYASTSLFAARFPGVAGRVELAPCNYLDVAATIMAEFGVTRSAPVHGYPMGPLIRGEETWWRTSIDSRFIGQIPDPYNGIPRWKSVWFGEAVDGGPKWRYASYYEVGQSDLYDLEADPYEQNNVVADHPDLVDEAQQIIAAADLDPLWELHAQGT